MVVGAGGAKQPSGDKCLSCWRAYIRGMTMEGDFDEVVAKCESDSDMEARFQACVRPVEDEMERELPAFFRDTVYEGDSYDLQTSWHCVGVTPSQFEQLTGRLPADLGIKLQDLPGPRGDRFKGVLMRSWDSPYVHYTLSRRQTCAKETERMPATDHSYKDQGARTQEFLNKENDTADFRKAFVNARTLDEVKALVAEKDGADDDEAESSACSQDEDDEGEAVVISAVGPSLRVAAQSGRKPKSSPGKLGSAAANASSRRGRFAGSLRGGTTISIGGESGDAQGQGDGEKEKWRNKIHALDLVQVMAGGRMGQFVRRLREHADHCQASQRLHCPRVELAPMSSGVLEPPTSSAHIPYLWKTSVCCAFLSRAPQELKVCFQVSSEPLHLDSGISHRPSLRFGWLCSSGGRSNCSKEDPDMKNQVKQMRAHLALNGYAEQLSTATKVKCLPEPELREAVSKLMDAKVDFPPVTEQALTARAAKDLSEKLPATDSSLVVRILDMLMTWERPGTEHNDANKFFDGAAPSVWTCEGSPLAKIKQSQELLISSFLEPLLELGAQHVESVVANLGHALRHIESIDQELDEEYLTYMASVARSLRCLICVLSPSAPFEYIEDVVEVLAPTSKFPEGTLEAAITAMIKANPDHRSASDELKKSYKGTKAHFKDVSKLLAEVVVGPLVWDG